MLRPSYPVRKVAPRLLLNPPLPTLTTHPPYGGQALGFEPVTYGIKMLPQCHYTTKARPAIKLVGNNLPPPSATTADPITANKRAACSGLGLRQRGSLNTRSMHMGICEREKRVKGQSLVVNIIRPQVIEMFRGLQLTSSLPVSTFSCCWLPYIHPSYCNCIP